MEMFATDMENYLTVSGTTLRVAADTVNLMDEDPEYSLSGEEHPKQTIEE